MSELSHQLAKVFKHGLAANPKAANSLGAALAKHSTDEGVTKAEANYRTSHETGKECGSCKNFDGTHGCKVVSGSVTADGVCDYWTGSDSGTKSDKATDSSPSQVEEEGD